MNLLVVYSNGYCRNYTKEIEKVEKLPYPSNQDFLDSFAIVKNGEELDIDDNKLIYSGSKKYSIFKLFGLKDEIIKEYVKLSECGSRSDEIIVGYNKNKKSSKGEYRASVVFNCQEECSGIIELVSFYVSSNKNKDTKAMSDVVALDSKICKTIWNSRGKIIDKSYSKYIE